MLCDLLGVTRILEDVMSSSETSDGISWSISSSWNVRGRPRAALR